MKGLKPGESVGVSELFIQRPVATTILMLALVLFGAVAYTKLPVAELPNVDFPSISVSASLPGADPETMAATVATPLERAFTQIPGLDVMNSTSSTGSTQISLTFALDRDIDSASQDVQNAIAQTVRQLPSALPNPPTLRKVNPADAPILFMALSTTSVPMTTLNDFAQTRVADSLSRIEGVAQVSIYGSKMYAARLYVNPQALSARGLSFIQLRNAIANGNSYQPGGTLYGAQRSYTLEADGQLRNAAAYNDLVVTENNGAPVRFRDVGKAVDSIQNDKQAATYNGRPAIIIAVTRQPGSNTVEIAEKVRAILSELAASGPGDTKIDITYDRSEFIQESIHEVKFTLILSIILVVAVIFVFLRDTRATVISALALPAALLGTFGAMQLMGFSLDNLSLMALTLSVGFVVDDAIVVLENIIRYKEQGMTAREAASKGAREIGFTVISMTISLVAVFIPILFMGGLIGRLFREFAMTVSVAILLSAAISLTLTPMLCARWLKDGEDKHGKLYLYFERLFDAMRDGYEKTLRWALGHNTLMLLGSVAILIGTVFMFRVVPTGFIPAQDTGVIFANTRAPDGVTFEELQVMQNKAAELVQKNPNVAGVFSATGSGGGGSSNPTGGRMTIRLTPHGERKDSADQVIAQLRKAMTAVPQLQAFFSNPPAIRIGGNSSNSNYQYVLQADDLKVLAETSERMLVRLREVPGLRDPNSDLQLANPQIDLDINRDRASALGVTVADIQNTLYAAYGAARISTIYSNTAQYDVLLQMAPEFQLNINALKLLYVPSTSGRLVPIEAVASIRPSVGPLSITHYQQLSSVTLSFDLVPGVALGDVTSKIEAIAAEELKGEVSGTFAGTAETFKQSTVDLPILLVFSILVIYMVLAILYEHFVHPLTILTSLPLAAIGALVALWVFGLELNIFSFVGLILLVGLVKKNGIIMVDFALQKRREGATAEDAMMEACLVRFRPIMMTTLAAIFGTLPIALALGAGAESRQPLGIAVVGGLLTSQLLTLYFTPAFYIAMERFLERFKGKREAVAAPVETT
ncbi:MAG: efflux RND transporter permease subunit [Stagnimonas sp.]|nr:efflux RND transporter permease subunit [Stagnimonas sp.]